MHTLLTRTLALGTLLCGLLSLNAHAASDANTHKAEESVEFEYRGDADKGKSLSTTCAACHGPTGNSMVPSFPKIAGQHARYIYKQLQDMKPGEDGEPARSVPTMAGIVAGLSKQDMADLAAYFEKQAGSVEGANKELIALGEKIYRSGNLETSVPACTGCHQPDGAGLGLAGYPKLAGQYADYTAKQLRAFRAAAREDINAEYRVNDGDSMVMQLAAKGLTDKEIVAVSAYVSGLMANSQSQEKEAE